MLKCNIKIFLCNNFRLINNYCTHLNVSKTAEVADKYNSVNNKLINIVLIIIKHVHIETLVLCIPIIYLPCIFYKDNLTFLS